ncbi:MAG TPA: hypothetical protein VGZ32_00270 [Actinocrinis sp.]|jgi:hypothetical protein|uniref:hypothetical protein n=1 Tax=Actinocrinis sp. TaxID=1920516 RepID=UPI002DDD81A0|nr:hypothetical protein [Actinocrinis sp.]HEV3168735.1 hypothetical protein [Actinocrinis sp.]
MARTYLSTLSPRRRWGIAGSAAGAVVLLTVGLGNPWTAASVARLATQPGFDRVPLLAHALSVFHWSLTPSSYGAPADHSAGYWASGLVLDLGWPLLVLVVARMLAGGLAMRRAQLSLVLGVWSAATLTAALIGLAAGLIDHTLADGMRALSLPLAPKTRTGDVITLQAATMALLGAALGWLPGIVAAVGYAVKRPVPGAATSVSGEEPTKTLDLAGLEKVRSARRRGTDLTLPDPGGSNFFVAE